MWIHITQCSHTQTCTSNTSHNRTDRVSTHKGEWVYLLLQERVARVKLNRVPWASTLCVCVLWWSHFFNWLQFPFLDWEQLLVVVWVLTNVVLNKALWQPETFQFILCDEVVDSFSAEVLKWVHLSLSCDGFCEVEVNVLVVASKHTYRVLLNNRTVITVRN